MTIHQITSEKVREIIAGSATPATDILAIYHGLDVYLASGSLSVKRTK